MGAGLLRASQHDDAPKRAPPVVGVVLTTSVLCPPAPHTANYCVCDSVCQRSPNEREGDASASSSSSSSAFFLFVRTQEVEITKDGSESMPLSVSGAPSRASWFWTKPGSGEVSPGFLAGACCRAWPRHNLPRVGHPLLRLALGEGSVVCRGAQRYVPGPKRHPW